MMTVTIKVTKRQLIGAAAVFLLAFGAGLWGKAAFTRLAGETKSDSAAMQSSANAVEIFKAPAKTNEQRLALLSSLGWEVEPEAEEVLEILIPGTFDNVLLSYNEIQVAQGCDLMRYRDKTCTRYTYVVTNHPQSTGYIRANLLVYKDKVIGGDISNIRQDGFMLTLRGEEVQGSESTPSASPSAH